MGHAIARSTDAGTRGSTELTHAASQYLTFTTGRELFALPIAVIREVVEFNGMTRVPLAPAAVPGVLNLRGAVVPVVDLAARLSRAPTTIGRRTCVIVVETLIEGSLQPMGVIVDAVSEALMVDQQQIEHKPAFGAGLRSEFVASMLRLDGHFVVVLDVDKLLSIAELDALVRESALHERLAPTMSEREA